MDSEFRVYYVSNCLILNHVIFSFSRCGGFVPRDSAIEVSQTGIRNFC